MNLIYRRAYLAPDAGSTNIGRNILVAFKILGTIPIISMAQHTFSLGDDQTDPEQIEYDRSYGSSFIGSPTEENFINHPIDPEMDGRFTPVAFISKTGANNIFYLYHDNKYMDMLLMPSLRSIGDTDMSSSYLRGKNFEIVAYRVGSTLNDGNFKGFVRSPDVDIPGIPKPIAIASSKVHHMPTFFPGQQPLYSKVGTHFPNAYLESDSIQTNPVVSIGSSSAVFDSKVPISRVVDVGFSRSILTPAGVQDVADILIPVP